MVPEPLEVPEPLVAYEFIRMADSTGFGDYTESGQVIPVTYEGKPGTMARSLAGSVRYVMMKNSRWMKRYGPGG